MAGAPLSLDLNPPIHPTSQAITISAFPHDSSEQSLFVDFSDNSSCQPVFQGRKGHHVGFATSLLDSSYCYDGFNLAMDVTSPERNMSFSSSDRELSSSDIKSLHKASEVDADGKPVHSLNPRKRSHPDPTEYPRRRATIAVQCTQCRLNPPRAPANQFGTVRSLPIEKIALRWSATKMPVMHRA